MGPATRQVPGYETLLWRGSSHHTCVIIPVINEGRRIQNLLARMAAQQIHTLADILIVDGGSTDGSLAISFLQQHHVRGLLLKTGPGRLSAQLRCAYAFALDQGYTGIITIDGNDKDDPAAIPAFIRALEEGIDFVQASRFIPGGIAENTPPLRRLAIRLIHAPLLSITSGHWWTDTTQGFRAYSSRMLQDPQVDPFRDIFSEYELLAYLSWRAPRLGYRCTELPTTRRYPPGKVPTKIGGLRGELKLLATLLHTILGHYNPDRPTGFPK